MRSTRGVCALSFVLAAACGDEGKRDDGFGDNLPPPGGDGGGDGTDGGPGDDGGGGDDDGGVRFDIGIDNDLSGPGDGDGTSGCEKVDFLFVIDNSGSMEDEQQNLVTSFPGFISTISGTLQAQDYHIMAIDTDSAAAGGVNITCSPAPQCCDSNCMNNPGAICNGMPCLMPNDPCDPILGAGRNDDLMGNACNFATADRYLLDGQPDLGATFACAARVGSGGNGDEQQMAAMIESVTTLNAAGECNEGFVRDDAILVVTVISDEEDDPNDADGDVNSPGDPASWKQALIDVKQGDEKAIVVLGLLGDTDVPGGVCQAMNGNMGAEPAPRLRQFAESFMFGQWGSVCEPDYAPFFEAAVSVIDTACDEYVPPG